MLIIAIYAAGGNQHQIIVDGKSVPNYGFVQGIFIGVVAGVTAIVAFFGPE